MWPGYHWIVGEVMNFYLDTILFPFFSFGDFGRREHLMTEKRCYQKDLGDYQLALACVFCLEFHIYIDLSAIQGNQISRGKG